MLASRGSGDTLGKDHGLSAPGLALTNGLRRTIPDVAKWANPYDAVGVFKWNLRQLANGGGAITKLPGLGAYHASVVQGKRLLDAEVASIASVCGNRTALILVGYSQGAQVTADVYQRQLTSAQRSVVAAVVLFGDPYFNGGDRRADHGSFSGRRDGLLGRRPPFGANGRTLVLSYCHSHDPICQGLFFRLGPTRTLDPGSLTVKQHTNYTKFGEPQQAADMIAERLGVVDISYSGQIGALTIDVSTGADITRALGQPNYTTTGSFDNAPGVLYQLFGYGCTGGTCVSEYYVNLGTGRLESFETTSRQFVLPGGVRVGMSAAVAARRERRPIELGCAGITVTKPKLAILVWTRGGRRLSNGQVTGGRVAGIAIDGRKYGVGVTFC